MSKRVNNIALLVALSCALALTTCSASAGWHYHRHGYFGGYDDYPQGFCFGLGARYGTYYYAPPPVYYCDPEPGCGRDYVRDWRCGCWRAARVWRCW